MIVGQKVMERINSPTFCWRSPTKAVFNTVMYGCILHSLSVLHNFWHAFSSETTSGQLRPTGVRGPQFEKHWPNYCYSKCLLTLYIISNYSCTLVCFSLLCLYSFICFCIVFFLTLSSSFHLYFPRFFPASILSSISLCFWYWGLIYEEFVNSDLF
jgi:hypothetical protein